MVVNSVYSNFSLVFPSCVDQTYTAKLGYIITVYVVRFCNW